MRDFTRGAQFQQRNICKSPEPGKVSGKAKASEKPARAVPPARSGGRGGEEPHPVPGRHSQVRALQCGLLSRGRTKADPQCRKGTEGRMDWREAQMPRNGDCFEGFSACRGLSETLMCGDRH